MGNDDVRIRPRNDVVLVKRKQEEYGGKLVIPDSAKEKPLEAIVVRVGPGALVPFDVPGSSEFARFWLTDIKTGDTIFLGRYAGTEIEENGEKLLFVREHEILGVRE